ncbi:MAG: hypothetical protein HKN48_07820 [Flavobacteriaceae bacterium]|nr:hypothetical protein [Flavobacteriaceae bacterium]
MKKIFLLLTLVLLACSDDDGNAPFEETNPPTLSISVISSTSSNNGIIEMDIQTNGGTITTYNLTQTIGVPLTATPTYSKNNQATWYESSFGQVDVWQKNLESGNSTELTSVCDVTGEFPLMVDNSVYNVFIGTRYQDNDGIHGRMRIFNGSACILETLTDFRIRSIFELDNEVLIYCTSNAANNVQKVVKMKLETAEVVDELVLSNSAKIAVDGDTMHVFFVNADYNTYSVSNFNFISNSSLQLNYDDVPFGFINSEFVENTMYTRVTYAQPGLIPNGPALLDLQSGELITPYNLLYDINNNLNAISTSFYDPTGTYDVNVASNIVVVGYFNGANEFGIVVSNFNAEIFEVIPLDYFPSEIFIR